MIGRRIRSRHSIPRHTAPLSAVVFLALMVCVLIRVIFLGVALGHSLGVTGTAGKARSQSRVIITGGTVGLPTKYTTGSGDTWYNTWGGNGNIYATSDDTSGFNGTCNSDIAVNELVGNDPTHLTAPFVNCMNSYGHAGDVTQHPDGCDWKSGGIISVDGTLYLTVARQTGPRCTNADNGEQPSLDASIVKSSNYGRTWSNSFGMTKDPNGAAPPWNLTLKRVDAMFPGQTFTPFFINYGENDDPDSTANGGNTYVYAVSTNGFAYDGSYLILGRVLRSQIGALNAANWQFYTGRPGGNGMDADHWSHNIRKATHILVAPRKLSQPDVQYDAPLHTYILTTFYYPFSVHWPEGGTAHQSTFVFYRSPFPWGPWTRFYSQPTVMSVCYLNCQPTNSYPLGLYDPALVSKFIRMHGLSNILFSSGDFTDNSRYDDRSLYALHAFPFTLATRGVYITDDRSPKIHYSGSWIVGTFDSVGSDYFDNGTVHYTMTPGSSVSFSFTGSMIEWIGSTNKNHGYAAVSIDGGAPVLVDGYSAQWLHQVTLFKRTRLNPGHHTIVITLINRRAQGEGAGATYMDIDAFVTAGTSHGTAKRTFGVLAAPMLRRMSGGGIPQAPLLSGGRGAGS